MVCTVDTLPQCFFQEAEEAVGQVRPIRAMPGARQCEYAGAQQCSCNNQRNAPGVGRYRLGVSMWRPRQGLDPPFRFRCRTKNSVEGRVETGKHELQQQGGSGPST